MCLRFNEKNKLGTLYSFGKSVFGLASARSYKIGVVGNNWLVGWLIGWLVGWLVGNVIFSATARKDCFDFLYEVRGL